MITLSVTTYLTSYPSVTSTFTITVQYTCPLQATGLTVLTPAPTLSFIHDPNSPTSTPVQLSTFEPDPQGFNCFNVVGWTIYEVGGVTTQNTMFANFIPAAGTIELVGNTIFEGQVIQY